MNKYLIILIVILLFLGAAFIGFKLKENSAKGETMGIFVLQPEEGNTQKEEVLQEFKSQGNINAKSVFNGFLVENLIK